MHPAETDHPRHPPSLIRVFAVRFIIWVAKDPNLLQAERDGSDLSLCQVHRSFCWFCHALAQIVAHYFIWFSTSAVLLTSDHGVPGSNPTGGKILPEAKRHFIAQSLSCSHIVSK